MWIANTILAGALVLAAADQAGAPGTTSLRQAVEQYHSTASASTPWRLSAEERAELRRQLAESARRREAREATEAGRLATHDSAGQPTQKKRTPQR